MIECITDLDRPPIIGRYYRVPCVKLYRKWVPIIGARHNDLELNFAMFHYHRDVRFISDANLFNNRSDDDPAMLELGHVVDAANLRAIVLKRKLCVREMPEFPIYRNRRGLDIVRTLEAIYKGREVKCGRCPHKNMPLASLPRRADGSMICNGHGLRILDDRVVMRDV